MYKSEGDFFNNPRYIFFILVIQNFLGKYSQIGLQRANIYFNVGLVDNTEKFLKYE